MKAKTRICQDCKRILDSNRKVVATLGFGSLQFCDICGLIRRENAHGDILEKLRSIEGWLQSIREEWLGLSQQGVKSIFEGAKFELDELESLIYFYRMKLKGMETDGVEE